MQQATLEQPKWWRPARRGEPRPVAGNTATGTLKLLALVFMFCDHAGKMLLPDVPEMRMIGRLAFPIYCWCMVVGFTRTRSVPKYILRVLALGVISQPLYCLALDHELSKPNIMLTLVLALLGLWAIREKVLFSHIWGPVAVCALAAILGCDYGWKGVLLVLLLYAVRDSRPGIAAVMLAFCLFWGSTSSVVSSICGLSTAALRNPAGWVGTLLSPLLKLQALAILSLPFMLIRMKNLRLPPVVGYLIYPLHLAVLQLLRMLLA